jgi:hypothetical protein
MVDQQYDQSGNFAIDDKKSGRLFENMKFAYQDLSDDQFESLIVLLCQHLLGVSVQGFAKGPDGGRDAKFVGKAQLHPSTTAPWVGTTIVQAKHTNGLNRHFAEADFFSPSAEKTVLGKEIARIKKLREAKQLDHYMLFANRRLAGNAETEIRDYLASQCGIPAASIYLCGLEQLELWLKRFPQVAKDADLDPVDSPLIVNPDDLAVVVQALARQTAAVVTLLDDPPTVRVPYADKNALNNMSAEYAKEQSRKYLKETVQIRAFLAAPENLELLYMYESVVDEFQFKIIAKRKDYQTFDAVMEYLVDLLLNRDPVLRQRAHKRLTRAVLFYMYWNCDIGEVDDASADQTLSS